VSEIWKHACRSTKDSFRPGLSVAEHSLDLAYLAYRERYLANPYMDENAYADYCWSETLANPVTDGATHHEVAVQASGGQSCKDDIAATTDRTANEESRNTPPA
jgi:hypothetical protein